MQCVYLDVTKEQQKHNRVLQAYLSNMEPINRENEKYHRMFIQNNIEDEVERLLIQMTVEESVHWVLERRKQIFKHLWDPDAFDKKLWERVRYIWPQLELYVAQDIQQFSRRRKPQDIGSWNIEGYLLFSAQHLKWAVETIVQDVYQSCIDEQEREEFIRLLQFCAATEQSLLDDVYITLYKDQFVMVDAWGNDLQQIYLETLPAEEYRDVQMHDLLLSILLTMLPKTIHLFVVPETLTITAQSEQQKLLELLQQIFGARLCVEKEGKPHL